MYSPTEYSLDSYEPNDRHVINEERECKGMLSRNGTTVTPYLLKEWRENMMFWKNHDTCRRMFNWVREVLGSLDEYYLKKLFNKLLHDGELINDHVRMYLHIRGYNVERRDIIDTPYWMHVALLQVMHLIYLDDDIMLSELIEELAQPHSHHKNTKNITIMLNMFFGYISERPFLMTEFPMNNWRNYIDHGDTEILIDNFDEGPSTMDVMIDEGYIESKDCPNVNQIDDFTLTVDDSGYSGDDSDVQPCSTRFISSAPSPSDIEVNDVCVDKSINCPNNEGATYTTDEENESACLIDIINTAKNLNEGLNNQLIDTPSLMDAHPSWDTLVFQSSPRGSGRRTKLRVTSREKAQFNTHVFNAFLGMEQEKGSLASFTSKSNDRKLAAVRTKNGIFFGLTIFFNDRALHIGENLKVLVTCNGGKVCDKLRKTATHIITCKPIPWYKVDGLRRNTNCRVVKPEWILECLRVGRRVNENAFNMAGLQQTQPTILSFINESGSDDDLSNTKKREREVNDISDLEESENKRRRVNSYVDPDDC
ncbi:hypothetical protein C1645_870281 [Glomus cerebriforme]|uniref:BRCT domain-containing protein n=1 Tax=Glomus cerebriforme TaxID=658196 RepID=A0A397TV42_9GLOM|nr:hypothetical protein C1645_870281 [Glomus cerebriforme]